LLEGKHDLRCTVPSRGDVFRHETRLCSRWFGGLDTSCQAEITDFQITVSANEPSNLPSCTKQISPISIEQQVRRLQIPMNHICRMQGFQSPEALVCEVLGMIVREVLCADHAVHVRLHQLLDYLALHQPTIIPVMVDKKKHSQYTSLNASIDDGLIISKIEMIYLLHKPSSFQRTSLMKYVRSRSHQPHSRT
jgi:hypothetical protein